MLLSATHWRSVRGNHAYLKPGP